jgi:phosphoesterase RecJ-like protein
MMDAVLRSIKEHKKFVLTSHSRPDGDAIGSVLALSQVLRSIGKEVDVILSDVVPVIYQWLPQSATIKHARQVNGDYGAAIILECDSLRRTGLEGLDFGGRLLVNIDHHSTAKSFADVNWIDSTACATAQMIFQLAKELLTSPGNSGNGSKSAVLTADVATCLYTAVLTDTGSFCFRGTSAQTFALAEELVGAGADPARIAQHIYFASPESKMRLLGAALTSLSRKGDLAWMQVSNAQMKELSALEEDCEGLVNYALGIEGVEVAIFFRELPDGRYRVSLRSKGAVNVAKVAERFGGGGHECASGCSLPGPLHSASQKIIAQFDHL